jgi:hypothetical protein
MGLPAGRDVGDGGAAAVPGLVDPGGVLGAHEGAQQLLGGGVGGQAGAGRAGGGCVPSVELEYGQQGGGGDLDADGLDEDGVEPPVVVAAAGGQAEGAAGAGDDPAGGQCPEPAT